MLAPEADDTIICSSVIDFRMGGGDPTLTVGDFAGGVLLDSASLALFSCAKVEELGFTVPKSHLSSCLCA